LADGSSAAAPSADNSAAISPAHPLRGRGTLSYQLVWRSTVLVAAVLIVVSGLWALSNQQILMQEIDNRLATALAQPFNGMMSSNATGAADNGGELIRVDVIGGMAYSQTQLDTTALSALMDVPAGAPATVDIPDLGDYRVLTGNQSGFRGGLASGVAGGSLTIVALPMSQVTGPMGIQLIVTSLLVLLAIGAVFAGTWVIVERSLRPLNRLAATADAVSVLPLETGEGVVPVRAGPADTNPRNEVGRVGQAFNHMLDNVESALAARHRSETKVRQFVADASHELRNPLAAIRGYAELTRRDRDVLPGQTAHALTRIEAESDRMSALVEDLLLLARLDSEPTMDLRPTDLPELVVDAVSDARAAGPDDHWLLELPDADVIVAADGNRLHQVVVNLLANARTHTPPGTTVVTRLFTEPGTAVIQVVDDGPGVPEAIQSTVFERFTRGDVSRVRRAGVSSTGLGLAIVQAVVTAHGGTVALDSHPGHTAFTVRLPLVPLAPSC